MPPPALWEFVFDVRARAWRPLPPAVPTRALPALSALSMAASATGAGARGMADEGDDEDNDEDAMVGGHVRAALLHRDTAIRLKQSVLDSGLRVVAAAANGISNSGADGVSGTDATGLGSAFASHRRIAVAAAAESAARVLAAAYGQSVSRDTGTGTETNIDSMSPTSPAASDDVAARLLAAKALVDGLGDAEERMWAARALRSAGGLVGALGGLQHTARGSSSGFGDGSVDPSYRQGPSGEEAVWTRAYMQLCVWAGDAARVVALIKWLLSMGA